MGNIMDFRASPTSPQAAGAMCGLLCRRPLPSRERLAVLNAAVVIRRRTTSKVILIGTTKQKWPGNRGAPRIQRVRVTGSSKLGRLDIEYFAGARDPDHPRLHRFRKLAHEVERVGARSPGSRLDLEV